MRQQEGKIAIKFVEDDKEEEDDDVEERVLDESRIGDSVRTVSDSFLGDSVSDGGCTAADGVSVQKGSLERVFDEGDSNNGQESQRVERVPWEREKDLFQSSSNTPLAEKLIPEFELKRLRNKAGRMVERFRVGAAGITQELVDSIHEKWKIDEVVKLKFKGPSTMNMKRVHESLESSISFLDGLGPRFKDWSGREPLPVDADLLPSLIEGYKLPFRLLPYGTRPGLRDKEMTFIRRTTRTMPLHFAIGRNRDLQGLAVAMAKLWERSAIAKIAIKRGVHNTCNERMAEELKTKHEKKASTFIDLTTKNAVKGPLVAGTLAETIAATSRWGTEPDSEEIERMRREAAVARHTSLVKLLENKLALANGKIKKAEKELAKVQEYLQPSQLPTDLETLTDEERFSLRKIGRRGVFDGTIENMHLHWKYRELVKIMVERKSFAQVKHVAISLEAESGGVLVSVDKTTKGYAIIVYRGKNYERPKSTRPKNLLTRRKALERAIELQRREALKYHIMELSKRIVKLKSELEDMKIIDEVDEETLRSRIEDNSGSESDSDDRRATEKDDEAYLETYKDGE
ncbi:hypothetical protein L1987_59790 [Smallanthus sonchifolius]|uniref:Uncharacterized protein n=1 Tax=Smallanthus sonchifolius TaxID=185202 RepID=A0ACB9D6F5_9ASTR|nr:hypothetical protein L1987_59790 [Smallanthus sonchifolius]